MAKFSGVGYKLLLFLELLALVLLVGTCTRRPADRAEEEQRQVSHSSDAVHITQDKAPDFSLIDTAHYYYGLVNDDAYFYKVNKLTSNSCSGVYYPMDSTTQWLASEAFTIEYAQNHIYFVSKGQRVPFEFDVLLDSMSLTGSFELENGELFPATNHLVFTRYQNPPFQTVKSKRFSQEFLDVKVLKDIQYGQAKGFWTSYQLDESKFLKTLLKNLGKTITPKSLKLTLDLYMPENDTIEEHPLFVLMHGGAFYFGDKGAENMRLWCEHFAKMGYVVASVNYRLGFLPNKAAIQRCGYEAIQDANAALRFLVHHAEQYGIDTSNVFVGGTSAGSITMLSMAFMNDYNCPDFVREHNFKKKLGSLKTGGNDIRQSFKIKAIANMWGALYDLKEIDSRPVPVISFHGDCDNVVPFDRGIPFSDVKGKIGERLFDTMYGSQAIHEHLDSLRVRNEFYPLRGMKHAPYEDASGHVNDVYYFIQNKMQAFFLKEIQRVAPIREISKKPLQYAIKQDDIQEIQWKVEGGFILERNGHTVTVVWRKDAPRNVISATGRLKNGAPFYVQKKISKPRFI